MNWDDIKAGVREALPLLEKAAPELATALIGPHAGVIAQEAVILADAMTERHSMGRDALMESPTHRATFNRALRDVPEVKQHIAHQVAQARAVAHHDEG